LDLGKLIVRELAVDRDGDTLGRWMAHYIAQLLEEAEAAADQTTRREIEAAAAEIVTKLWTHRGEFQNRINPLSDLRPIIDVLRSLDPDQSSWTLRYKLDSGSPIQGLYDTFQRLIISMIALQKGGSRRAKQAVARARATTKFQDEKERKLLALLDGYLGNSDDSTANPPNGNVEGDVSEIDHARSLVTEARGALDRIVAELDELEKASAAKSKRRSPAKKTRPKR
jgi:hypothetical protein